MLGAIGKCVSFISGGLETFSDSFRIPCVALVRAKIKKEGEGFATQG